MSRVLICVSCHEESAGFLSTANLSSTLWGSRCFSVQCISRLSLVQNLCATPLFRARSWSLLRGCFSVLLQLYLWSRLDDFHEQAHHVPHIQRDGHYRKRDDPCTTKSPNCPLKILHTPLDAWHSRMALPGILISFYARALCLTLHFS